MKVLVVGSGGREHALAWSIARSETVDELFVAPGNAGTAAEPKITNVDIDTADFDALISWVREIGVGLTVVGPEQHITEGIRDAFDSCELKCFAPSKVAAQLEGSKSFAKSFMRRHQIPTADSLVTSNRRDAIDYITEKGTPIVVKADGLAAGKGVTVAHTTAEAVEAVEAMLSGESFGNAGKTVVIEDFLDGEEASLMLLADGLNVVPFASSQDHKPVFDEDRGPNTGGMGAYSPAPVMTPAIASRVISEIVEPTMLGMVNEGMPFQGFLYVGLMIGADGSPFVVEYNCRFGDPEAQPIMMRLESDLVQFCLYALDGCLSGKSLEFGDDATVGVVLASQGYPGSYQTGKVIEGLGLDRGGVKTFHAGTKIERGRIVTNGGRVLCVVGQGTDVVQAQRIAYNRVNEISWEGMQYRRDIGHKAIARL